MGRGERKSTYLLLSIGRKLLSQEHQAPVTAAGRALRAEDPASGQGVWAASQSSWGVRTLSPAPVTHSSLPRAVFTELREATA